MGQSLKVIKYKLFKIYKPKNIGREIEKVYKSGVITEGKYSELFEKKFAKFINNKNCVLVNSGTSALTLAYRLIGIKKGDEVIVTPLTCMATNEPLDVIGAKLVFADIDPETGNIDLADLKKKINSKTKAVSFVHWSGQPFDIKNVKKICKKYNVKIVEDAAHALGAKYQNKQIGNHGNYCIFSFQAIKHLSSVDGGVLVCRNKKEVERAKKLRWFGLKRDIKGNKWKQDIVESGYKFHMNNIISSIGLLNLKGLRNRINKYISNGKYYDQNIKNRKVKLFSRKISGSSYWIYSLLVDDKKNFKKYLNSFGIETDEVHVRNDQYTVFKKYKKKNLKGTEIIEKKMLNIPVGWWLKRKDLKYITDVINDY